MYSTIPLVLIVLNLNSEVGPGWQNLRPSCSNGQNFKAHELEASESRDLSLHTWTICVKYQLNTVSYCTGEKIHEKPSIVTQHLFSANWFGQRP